MKAYNSTRQTRRHPVPYTIIYFLFVRIIIIIIITYEYIIVPNLSVILSSANTQIFYET